MLVKKMDELRPYIRSYWTSGDQPVQGVANGAAGRIETSKTRHR